MRTIAELTALVDRMEAACADVEPIHLGMQAIARTQVALAREMVERLEAFDRFAEQANEWTRQLGVAAARSSE